MADQSIPRKNQAYTLATTLVSQADANLMENPPTVAAGDVRVSVDGGAFGATTAAPTVTPAADVRAQVVLTADEMNGDVIVVAWSDAAGAQWQDQTWVLFPTDNTLAVLAASIAAVPAAVWAVGVRTLTSFGTLVADVASAVWSFATRTLTMSAAAIVAAVSGTSVTQVRATTWNFSITGMGSIADRAEFFFTLKRRTRDGDADALVKIEETIGLQVINGQTAGTPANGSITVTDAAAGDVTVVLADEETAKLSEEANLVYDFKKITAGGVSTQLTTSRFNITSTVTEET